MLGNATIQPSSSKLDLLQILQKIVSLKLKLLLTLLYFQSSIQIFIIMATFLLYLGPCSILGTAGLGGIYIQLLRLLLSDNLYSLRRGTRVRVTYTGHVHRKSLHRALGALGQKHRHQLTIKLRSLINQPIALMNPST